MCRQTCALESALVKCKVSLSTSFFFTVVKLSRINIHCNANIIDIYWLFYIIVIFLLHFLQAGVKEASIQRSTNRPKLSQSIGLDLVCWLQKPDNWFQPLLRERHKNVNQTNLSDRFLSV